MKYVTTILLFGIHLNAILCQENNLDFAPPSEPYTISAHKANVKIKLDGKLNEPSWAEAEIIVKSVFCKCNIVANIEISNNRGHL